MLNNHTFHNDELNDSIIYDLTSQKTAGIVPVVIDTMCDLYHIRQSNSMHQSQEK